MVFIGKLIGKQKTVAEGHAAKIDEWLNVAFTDKTVFHGSGFPLEPTINAWYGRSLEFRKKSLDLLFCEREIYFMITPVPRLVVDKPYSSKRVLDISVQ